MVAMIKKSERYERFDVREGFLTHALKGIKGLDVKLTSITDSTPAGLKRRADLVKRMLADVTINDDGHYEQEDLIDSDQREQVERDLQSLLQQYGATITVGERGRKPLNVGEWGVYSAQANMITDDDGTEKEGRAFLVASLVTLEGARKGAAVKMSCPDAHTIVLTLATENEVKSKRGKINVSDEDALGDENDEA